MFSWIKQGFDMFYENIEKTRAWPKILKKIMKNKENDYTF